MMMTRAGSPMALSSTITMASARSFIGTTSLRSVGPSETAISVGASWVTEGKTSRYDALLDFPGTNWGTGSIRNEMVNLASGCAFWFSVNVAAGDADGADY